MGPKLALAVDEVREESILHLPHHFHDHVALVLGRLIDLATESGENTPEHAGKIGKLLGDVAAAFNPSEFFVGEQQPLLHVALHALIRDDGHLAAESALDEVVLLGHAAGIRHALKKLGFLRRHAERDSLAAEPALAICVLLAHREPPS